MLFDSKNDFISALKDYHKYEDIIQEAKEKYRDAHYLRYNKVKSSLDYDIVGYKNGEAMRVIKGRGSFSEETISNLHEYLDNQLEFYLDRVTKYEKKKQMVEDELRQIEDPLRSILILRFRENVKQKDVAKRFNMSEGGMSKYINRELESYYDETI